MRAECFSTSGLMAFEIAHHNLLSLSSPRFLSSPFMSRLAAVSEEIEFTCRRVTPPFRLQGDVLEAKLEVFEGFVSAFVSC